MSISPNPSKRNPLINVVCHTTLMSGFLLLVTKRARLMSPKGQNASRDGLVKIGWVVYSLLFPCIFSLNKLLMPFFARMLGYQLVARFYNLNVGKIISLSFWRRHLSKLPRNLGAIQIIAWLNVINLKQLIYSIFTRKIVKNISGTTITFEKLIYLLSIQTLIKKHWGKAVALALI